mmetsp:Transcript_11665/g.25036  ORF Transcript_11665/g.25036 Transcript_11665/m.25036 type:complete len:627 (-) Transcript_11665:258-2138(-)
MLKLPLTCCTRPRQAAATQSRSLHSQHNTANLEHKVVCVMSTLLCASTIYCLVLSVPTVSAQPGTQVNFVQPQGRAGACRSHSSVHGTSGTFELWGESSDSNCRRRCAELSHCVGYEWGQVKGYKRCELHSAPISHTVPVPGYTCWIKVAEQVRSTSHTRGFETPHQWAGLPVTQLPLLLPTGSRGQAQAPVFAPAPPLLAGHGTPAATQTHVPTRDQSLLTLPQLESLWPPLVLEYKSPPSRTPAPAPPMPPNECLELVRPNAKLSGPPNHEVELVTSGGVGIYGGECTCPDGTKFFAGDEGNSCGSLSCYNGGISGPCQRMSGPWTYKKVTCKGCPNLRRAQLRGVNLEGADLSRVDLSEANLEGAYLRNAVLLGANCRGTNFRGAFLDGADFTESDLTGATLSGAFLKGARFGLSTLTRTNLSFADLSDADLSNTATSEQTIFDGAIAQGLFILNSRLHSSSWEKTKLSGALLEGVSLKRSTFRPSFDEVSGLRMVLAKLDYAVMVGAVLNGIILDSTSMNHASMHGASMRNAELSGAQLKLADVRGVDFTRSDVSKCDFSGGNLERAIFTAADVTDAVFDSARCEAADFAHAVGVQTISLRAIQGTPFGLTGDLLLTLQSTG